MLTDPISDQRRFNLPTWPGMEIPLPTGRRRADNTYWLGMLHDAGAFPRQRQMGERIPVAVCAQVMDCRPPVNDLLTIVA
jgi:hypothetical protein